MAFLSEVQEIKKIVWDELEKDRDEGIRFAIAGTSGHGKTTTVNTLFNVNMKVDPVVRATTDINQVSLLVHNARRFPRERERDVTLQVYDLPGLNDGHKRGMDSERYRQEYLQLLPTMDVVLWVLKADDRDYGSDIEDISVVIDNIPSLKSKIVVGINVIDKIEPNDWSKKYNRPSKEQRHNLIERQRYVISLVHNQCGLNENNIVLYSAKMAYGLENLFLRLIQTCPDDKKWVFSELHLDYSEKYLSHVDENVRDEVRQKLQLDSND